MARNSKITDRLGRSGGNPEVISRAAMKAIAQTVHAKNARSIKTERTPNALQRYLKSDQSKERLSSRESRRSISKMSRLSRQTASRYNDDTLSTKSKRKALPKLK